MTTPRQPEQATELDLTETEVPPTSRAVVVVQARTSISIKLMFAKYFVLETVLDEAESNFQTAALLHFAVMMVLAGGITALVKVLSGNLWVALGAGAFTLGSAVLFVRTANFRKAPAGAAPPPEQAQA